MQNISQNIRKQSQCGSTDFDPPSACICSLFLFPHLPTAFFPPKRKTPRCVCRCQMKARRGTHPLFKLSHKEIDKTLYSGQASHWFGVLNAQTYEHLIYSIFHKLVLFFNFRWDKKGLPRVSLLDWHNLVFSTETFKVQIHPPPL